jgi:hypothetical protein
MRSGTRHALGAVIGIAVAGVLVVLLLAGEYEASLTQGWAATQQGPGTGSVAGSAPVGSIRAAALIVLAGAAVGVLCSRRRLSPAAPLAAGLPLALLGLLSWLDTWRMTLLATGSLSQPWSRLVTDQVFLVTGGVLLLAAAAPSRWRPPLGPVRGPRHWTVLAVVLGLVAAPVTWYLVQLTNLTPANYPASYWWPLRQNADDSVDVLFLLVVATLGVLAASRSLRITAIIAGAPMLVLGLTGLIAPTLANDLAGSVGLGSAWRYAILVDLTSGLPLLYGAMLVTSGLTPAGSSRAVAPARRAKAARFVPVPLRGEGRALQMSKARLGRLLGGRDVGAVGEVGLRLDQ